MMLLQAVHTNDIQKFGLGNYGVTCQPYGILSLDKLYRNMDTTTACSEAIRRFYKKNPLLYYFSSSILYIKQLYHVEIRAGECIVYARGQTTLSELLVRQGLALVQPFFKDDEFLNMFAKAQRNASIEKLGMWSDATVAKCVLGSGKD